MTVATEPRTLPFENGDMMSREEFHRLYSECPGLERVELIEGVVFLPSPIRFQGHTREQGLMFRWLADYADLHDGVVASLPTSVLLDDVNEPEPDVVLFRDGPGAFKDGYLAKAPELIVEIAASSASRDLHQKKDAYERNGVREYIVWRTRDEAIDWFRLVNGSYVLVAPGADEEIESVEFPGLRLDIRRMLAAVAEPGSSA